jgi:methylmalonyl-CoA mutase cobalamin-binding domain/chain
MKTTDFDERAELVAKLKRAVLDGDFESAPGITGEALEAGIQAERLMEEAISDGISELEGKLFSGYKVWPHPILLLGMEAARRSLEILESRLRSRQEEPLGTVVLGTPAGDVHDHGGKMVALALMAAGFKVVYLGRDVPSSLFIDKVNENGARILALSSYQPTGFERIKEILDLLSTAGMRDKVKVMVGGCSITEKFADKFGLGYARSASAAVRLAKRYAGGV